MVALQFSSLEELINFSLIIDIRKCKVNKLELILICVLTESEIELAQNGFQAKVLRNMP